MLRKLNSLSEMLVGLVHDVVCMVLLGLGTGCPYGCMGPHRPSSAVVVFLFLAGLCMFTGAIINGAPIWNFHPKWALAAPTRPIGYRRLMLRLMLTGPAGLRWRLNRPTDDAIKLVLTIRCVGYDHPESSGRSRPVFPTRRAWRSNFGENIGNTGLPDASLLAINGQDLLTEDLYWLCWLCTE